MLAYLNKKFEITQMDVGVFLGLEINKKSDGRIFVHQTMHREMENCYEVSNSSDTNQQLHAFTESDASKYPYRELIGSLMYLAIGTRPDIDHSVSVASRFLEKPTVVDKNAGKCILRFLKKTINFEIVYSSDKSGEVKAYSDADYAGCIDTRRSTSGFTFIFGEGAISWGSERQKSVSFSTTESEYMAAALCVKELV